MAIIVSIFTTQPMLSTNLQLFECIISPIWASIKDAARPIAGLVSLSLPPVYTVSDIATLSYADSNLAGHKNRLTNLKVCLNMLINLCDLASGLQAEENV